MSQLYLQVLISGLLTGAVYSVIGIGFTLVFGVMKIVNFAHGHLVVVAMFVSYVLVVQCGMNPYLTLVAVVPLMFALGCLIHLGVIKRLIGVHDFEQIIATIGVMIILENVMNLIFGGDMRGITGDYTTESVVIGSVMIPIGQAYAAIGSLITVIALGVFLKTTAYGNALRASADNLTGSFVVGIKVQRIYMFAFGLSCTLAGIAGTLMLPLSVISPFGGTDIIVKGFIITIIGGLGSIFGALIAGILVGAVESYSTLLGDGSYGNAVVFSLLIATLIFRPKGLFGGRAG